jgi:hypothetical protein
MGLLSDYYQAVAKKDSGTAVGGGLINVGDTSQRSQSSYSTQSTYAPTSSSITSIKKESAYTDARVFAPVYTLTLNSPQARTDVSPSGMSAPQLLQQQRDHVESSQRPSIIPSIESAQKESTDGGGTSLIGGSSAAILAFGAVAIGAWYLLGKGGKR